MTIQSLPVVLCKNAEIFFSSSNFPTLVNYEVGDGN